jgi:SAM-dependent methyltransferase
LEISKNAAIEALPWTGERYLPEVDGKIELEHLHRYLFASTFVKGKRVLDIASGEGYGSALLATVAETVVGVDIAPDAIEFASGKYQSGNLAYKVGSCSAIPLDSHSVDVVVSFETIEHHDEHDAMMREIKRVLVPNGLLVISSPDKLEYSDKPNYSNPYHVKELYREEFEGLLNSCFKNHTLAGQRVVYGSAIFSEQAPSLIRSYELNREVTRSSCGVSNALYLVAIASDDELPEIESGMLEQDIAESELAKQLQGQLSKQIDISEQSAARRDLDIANLWQAVSDKDVQISNRDLDIANLWQAVSDKDVQISNRDLDIANLWQAVSDKDVQISNRDLDIANLWQAVSDKDVQISNRDLDIANLWQAVSDKDVQISNRDLDIANLWQAVSEKDAQISNRDLDVANLWQAVSDKDLQISNLCSVVHDRNAQISKLNHDLDFLRLSFSYKIGYLITVCWRTVKTLIKQIFKVK